MVTMPSTDYEITALHVRVCVRMCVCMLFTLNALCKLFTSQLHFGSGLQLSVKLCCQTQKATEQTTSLLLFFSAAGAAKEGGMRIARGGEGGSIFMAC